MHILEASTLSDLTSLAAFAVAVLLLNLLLGADMTYVAATAARNGRANGIRAALGIGTGALVHVFATVAGISAVVAASAMAFTLLKWVGAAYLLYIAVRLFLDDSPAAPAQAAGHRRVFRTGMLINITNPKVALFFLAFLPQFVDPSYPPAPQLLLLGLWFIVSGTIVNLAVALVASEAARRVAFSDHAARLLRRVAGTFLAALAVQLALARNRAT